MMEWRMESGQGRARRTLTAAALALGFLIVSAAPSSLVTRSSAAERSLTARSTNDTTCPRDKLSDLRFASLAFIAVLGREGAAHDTMYLASRLQYPTSMTYVDIANVLTRSGEARGNEVEALYQQLLHRPAGPSARQAWARWVAGGTPTDLAVALLVSQEYWQRSGSTNGGWVDAVYRDVLGRVADPGGRAMWLAQLDSGRPHWAIARDIYNAREHRLALIGALYQRVLARPADPGGAGYWANQMLFRGERWVLTRLVASPDFWRRAQVAYGGAPTPQPPPCPKPVLRWPASPQLVYSLAHHPTPGSKLIALTFDDGPNPTWTPQILDVLKSRNVTATFFSVGSWAQRYPGLIRRELAEGHRVANHTWNHQSLTSLSTASQARVIRDTTNVINQIAGRPVVRCVRPPYGNRNGGTDAVAFGQGLSVIIWSRDSGDWERPGVSRIIAQSLDTRYDGGRGILGMHDGGGNRSQTVAALGPLIDQLRARGYQFTTIC